MRMFFVAVGVLAWLFALAVLWIFAENGGALAVIAAGIFAGVAIVALGLERVLKMLEEIRDRMALRSTPVARRDVVVARERQVTPPVSTIPA